MRDLRPPAWVLMVWVLGLVAAAFSASFALSSRRDASAAEIGGSPTPYRGSISPHVALPDFALHDQFGRPARLADFRGKPLLIAFVYALCEDICPLTASRIAWALDRLGPEAKRLNLLAITVQPETDTAERVIAFSRRHRLLHRWRYLIGSPAEVLPVLKAYGIAPEKLPEPGEDFAPNGEPGAHSAWIVLADADLRRVESWPQNELLNPNDLVHDLRLLIRGIPSGADSR